MAVMIPVGGDLWQWDLGRRVEVPMAAEGDLVDWTIEGECGALATRAEEDGTYPVPNGLLKCGKGLRAFLRRGEVTVCSQRLPVNRRQMPPDYEYEETPTAGYQELRKELLERIEAIEAQLGPGGAIAFGRGEPPEGLSASMYVDTDTYDIYGFDRD